MMKFSDADVFGCLKEWLLDLATVNHNEVQSKTIDSVMELLIDEGLLDYDIVKEWAFDAYDWDEKND